MTEIHGFIKPNRRPGELGIHSLDQFHFVAPHLAVAQNFYSEFGLDIQEKGNLLTVGTHGHPHIWGTIGEGPRKRHNHMSFGAFEDDIDRFAERLQSMEIKRLDPPPGVDSNGLWFYDHDGNLVEIKLAVKSSPDEKTRFSFQSAAPGQRGALFRSKMRRTHPRRLAHILMFTRDVRKAVEFYKRVLGLRLSDHSSDNIAFLHGVHGSDHHMIAFARSNAPGHHHFSWDVGTVDEIGAGAMHMLGSPRDGVSVATCWARTSFTTFRILGAASANIPPTSIIFQSIATGRREIFRRTIRFTLGGQTFRKISCIITRPEPRRSSPEDVLS
jgi:catechol-2,3-dioxygenase